MSAERREGGWWRGLQDREEGRRGEVSGLFKALVLCLPRSLEEGGGAHAFRETQRPHFHSLLFRLTAANGVERQSGRAREEEKRAWNQREASTEKDCTGAARFCPFLLSGSHKRNLPSTLFELHLPCTLLWQPEWDTGPRSPSQTAPLILGRSCSGFCRPF